RIEEALEIAELRAFPSVLAHGFITKSLVLDAKSRPVESLALLKQGLEVALEHDDYDAALRAYNNLASFLGESGDHIAEATEYARQGYELALKLGAGWNMRYIGGKLSYFASLTGDWDESIALAEELRVQEEEQGADTVSTMDLGFPIMLIWIHRGDVAA